MRPTAALAAAAAPAQATTAATPTTTDSPVAPAGMRGLDLGLSLARSLAAAHGGTTCIVDFAIQKKGGSLKEALDTWHAKAEGKTYANAKLIVFTDAVDTVSPSPMKIIRSKGMVRASSCIQRLMASVS